MLAAEGEEGEAERAGRLRRASRETAAEDLARVAAPAARRMRLLRRAPEFRRAEADRELITLPTGDGMALVFFRYPLAPAQCAV